MAEVEAEATGELLRLEPEIGGDRGAVELLDEGIGAFLAALVLLLLLRAVP